LKPAEEPTEEIEALEMGSLLHNILYEFYHEIRKKGIVIAKSNPEEFNTAFNLLFKIAKNKIEDGNFNSPLTFYEKEKLLGINGNRKNSLLYLFLVTEKENDENFIPEFFEVAFGNFYSGKDKTGSGNNFLKDLKAGKVKIRGKIDRIDMNKKEKSYEIIDYKLGGRKPSRDDLDEGISLQLPLYMYAAKELINAQLNKDFNPEIPKIYSLKSREGEFGKLPVNIGLKKNSPAEEKEALVNLLIQNCVEMIEKFVREINEGKFNLSTLKDREKKVCIYCSFRSICRIQEVN
jgi:ATP-dependent helicase/nuclease subunit B